MVGAVVCCVKGYNDPPQLPPSNSSTNAPPDNNPISFPPIILAPIDNNQNDNNLDPVNTGRGSMYLEARDFAPLNLPGHTLSATLAFGRFYSSDDTFNGPLGTNWNHNYNIVLTVSNTLVKIKTWNLSEEDFTNVATYYNGDGSSKLYKDGGNNFVWQLPHGTQYHFNAANNNQLASITDREGNTVTMFYGSNLLLTNVTDNAGRQLSLGYDSNGHLTQVVDPLDRIIANSYDSSGRLSSVADALGTKATYGYNGTSGSITTFVGGRGNTLQYAYNTAGQVVTATDAMGKSKHYSYNSAALSTTVANRNGNVTIFLNNSSQQYVAISNAAGMAFYQRDNQNHVTNMVDRLGYSHQYFYNNNGGCACNISGDLIMAIDPLNNTNSWAYETNFNFPIAFTNAVGNSTQWSYDSRGNLTNRTDALGNVTTCQYDTAGNRTAIIDANQHTYQFAYDQYGNMTSATDGLGNSANFQYDIVGRLLQRVDALQRTNSFNWDVRDHLTQWTNALGYADAWTYDGDGNITAWTNKLGYVMTYNYDNADRLTSVALPGSNNSFVSFAYDSDGNRIAVTNALGNAVYMGYDAVDRLTFMTNALRNAWAYSYDPNSRLTNTVDPNNHQSVFVYDPVGHLTAVTNALNQPVQFGYDPVGNLTNIIDARDNAVVFAYDPLNRLTNINYAAVSDETFQYDAVGNVTNYITRANQTIQLAYNANNKLVQKTYLASGNVMTFGYDVAGQLTNAVWAVGTTTNSALGFTYDAAGRLTNETQQITTAPAHNVCYQYDAMGHRTQLTYPDGSFVTYQYNSNGWLTAILDGGTSVIVSYTYDAAGHRIGRTLENSTFTVYDYDNAGQVTNIWDRKIWYGTTNTISRFQYGYDGAGNRLWVKRTNNVTDVVTAYNYNAVYSYDAINQLTNVQYEEMTNSDSNPSSWNNNVTYIFDATGNRSSVVNASVGTTAYTADALNRYTGVNGTALTYDGNGNLTSDGTWNYLYDTENRLIKAVMGSTNITYVYDTLGRLIERDNGGSTNRFYYAGWQTIEERNGNDAVVRKYVYGPGIDEPVRMIYNGMKCYYHSDGLASIAEMTDHGGNNLELYGYDDYGNPTILNGKGDLLSGSSYGNRLMFQGRDRDPDTGLYNFRHRYYSPGLGRFMQSDPARLAGGINLYAAFYNNPVRYNDPMGYCDQVPNLMGPLPPWPDQLPEPDPSNPLAPFDPSNPLSGLPGINDPNFGLQGGPQDNSFLNNAATDLGNLYHDITSFNLGNNATLSLSPGWNSGPSLGVSLTQNLGTTTTSISLNGNANYNYNTGNTSGNASFTYRNNSLSVSVSGGANSSGWHAGVSGSYHF